MNQRRTSSHAPRPTPHAPKVVDLLFEIGTEELPAAYLPDLIEQLGREADVLFKVNHLELRSVQSFGTPRRLVLIVKGLGSTQHKPGEEVRGPSKQAAYDGAGKPTKALEGFLRSQGGTLKQTKLVSSPKGEYVYLIKPPTATPTVKVLPVLLTQLIGTLRALKTMRWDSSGVRFARPIRWLLALYGATPVRCTFGSLASAPATRLGRPQQLRMVRVASLDGYLRTLKTAGVILDQAARRMQIEQTVTKAAKTLGGVIAPEMISHGLLDEVTCLVEEPVPLVGEFDRKYLTLPREVLLASMAKYQRVFSIEASGKILPRCIAILEGPAKKPTDVRHVIERILNARLADSLLFWTNDHRTPLDKVNLAGVTFHEKLGSMEDKTTRLRALSEPLAEAWQLTDQERRDLRRACQLAKADLVSTMVKEVPTLQGVVGKYYAKDAGEPADVAEAIGEQYLPTGDTLPKTLLGSALAVLDKYDTLTSYFGLGIMPTGDQDPFGLRRAAQGIVEVAWTIRRPLPLSQLLRARISLDPFRTAPPKEVAAVGQRIHRYLFERFYTFAWPTPASATGGPGPAPKPSTDCIDAVLSSPCDDLVDAMDRIVSLQQLSGHPGLLKAAKVIERTRNILRGAPRTDGDVEPGLLKEPQEHALWDVYRQHKDRVSQLITDRQYDKATMEFGELFFEPLHVFFDKVLVNVPDEALQRNRLALMRAIHRLYTDRIADLSKLTVLQREEIS